MIQPIEPQRARQVSVHAFRSNCFAAIFNSATRRPPVMLFILLLFGAMPVVEAEQPAKDYEQRNHVHLSATAERAVSNEEIRVTLATEHRGRNPAELARLANEDLAWATELIAAKKSVSVVTGNYQTFPLYDQKRQQKPTWQLVQEIVIRSESFSDVTELLGQLQSRLQIRGTEFSLTPATRRKVENELIEEAMAAFHDRAAVVGRSMPSTAYEIVNINIDTRASGGPEYRMHRAEAAMETMQMDSAVMAPTVAAGQATIAVHVRGSVVFP